MRHAMILTPYGSFCVPQFIFVMLWSIISPVYFENRSVCFMLYSLETPVYFVDLSLIL